MRIFNSKLTLLTIMLSVCLSGSLPAFGVMSDETARSTLATGDDATTAFTFSFPIDTGSAGSHTDLEVWLRTTATGAQTQQTETTHYSVSATNNNFTSGGTVTMVTAPAATQKLLILRNTPQTQNSNIGSSGVLKTLTNALDKLTRQIIDLQEQIDRCPKSPKTDVATLDTTLPSSVDRASKNLTWDVSGNVTATDQLSTGSANISAFGATLVDDDDAATGRNTLGMADADAYTTLNAAVTAIGATQTTLVIKTNQTLSATITSIPSTLTLKFEDAGKITFGDYDIISYAGHIEAPFMQIFDYTGTGTVIFAVGAVEKLYPQWWGGAGDNSTDNLTAVAAAISALPSTGGTIKLTAGKWQWDGTITLPEEPKLLVFEGEIGQGALGNTAIQAGTIIYPQQTDSSNCFKTDDDSTRSILVFRNFGIIGNGSDGVGIYLNKCASVRIENVHIEGMGSHGIQIHDSPYAVLDHCFVHTNGGWGIVSTKSSVQHFNNCVVQNNTSGNLTVNDQALYVAGSAAAHRNIRVTGGDYSMDGSGVDAPSIKLYYCNQSVIDGVYIENSFAGDMDNYVIYVRGHSTTSYPSHTHSDGIIIRNVSINMASGITGGTGYPVYLSKVDNVIVEGNLFSLDADQTAAATNTAPIYIDGYVNYLTMRNNQFFINDTPTDRDIQPYLGDSTYCSNLICYGVSEGNLYAHSTNLAKLYNGSIWVRIANSEESFLYWENAYIAYENEIVMY